MDNLIMVAVLLDKVIINPSGTNNARTDGTYFYVNDNEVSVHNTYRTLSKQEQIKELNWFLANQHFIFK